MGFIYDIALLTKFPLPVDIKKVKHIENCEFSF